ncbi:aldehyde dehydrogenase [Xylaria bambusicola]|uniref:aldehyde dehydrogenase n=1 Tax=Xylaria bambusicola TaxID=326684 RepID=UPI002007A7B2|nr:aldehyde dehydrogenase [Xylaria bambusicola]KAI0505850.1 aldehyde dehydrogenase [Xylaria bambusicola]
MNSNSFVSTTLSYRLLTWRTRSCIGIMAEVTCYQMWVAGEERPGKGELIPIEDPATGEIFATCHAASEEDVNDTITLAQAVFKSGVWSRESRHRRADVLDKSAMLLEAELPDLIALEVRQTGRAVREMKAQVPSLVRWLKYYASLLRVEERPLLPTMGKLHNFVDRVPLGVVVQITPFNHPLLIAVKKIAPALAAGNSVIVKPSELTPLTTLKLGAILKAAGLPDGVFNVLPGYGALTGKALVSHPLVRKVDVTGGETAGRAIGALVGGNLARYTAELGGKAPLIVFSSANIKVAVNGIAFGSFIASGQTCIASTRIIVDNKIFDTLLETLKAKTESIAKRMGSPTNLDSMMGPLVSAKQLQNVEGLVDEAVGSGAAEIVTGGKRLTGVSGLDGTDFSRGYFYEPTVLVQAAAIPREQFRRAAIWRKEIFGPVIVVVGFDTEAEALELANDSEYGLGAGIWTQDMSQAFRVSEQIDAGITWVNTHHRNDPSSPWGGSKTSSGLGVENGVEAYQAYTTAKSTIISYASTEEALASDDWFKDSPGAVRYG